mmetsp:Transcript_20841/g.59767  ORF Transcript_20841/g.59767 Transcript_20841/m.59767 type:complete len:468 (-) Transcript_20841:3802-5205(-)
MTPPMGNSNVNGSTTLVSATVAAIAGALVSLGYVLHLRRELGLLRLKLTESSECGDDTSALSTADKARERRSNTNGNALVGSPNRSEPVLIHPIGTITSPFPQRAGTPRQGLLAPRARSLLTLEDDLSFDIVDGLKEYSHVWVVFRFHLNPIGKGKDAKARRALSRAKDSLNKGDNTNDSSVTSCCNCGRVCVCSSQRPSFPTKIRPPRAGGKKMGCLSTRSPHRPNDIGLSLAFIEDITTESCGVESGGKKRRRVVIRLLGLDLVDQTPVFDLKPYVPWDSVRAELRVPAWVQKDDKLSEVRWSSDAKMAAIKARQDGELVPLYPPLSKRVRKRSQESNAENEIVQAITEIISQDPRSIHEGRGNADAMTFDITFCALRVAFRVTDEGDKSFAEIISAQKDQGDATAEPGSYQHSLYLRRQAEMEASRRGIKLNWMRPVQEGNAEGLYKLVSGKIWEPSGGIHFER